MTGNLQKFDSGGLPLRQDTTPSDSFTWGFFFFRLNFRPTIRPQLPRYIRNRWQGNRSPSAQAALLRQRGQGWAAGCRIEAVALSPRLKQLQPERIAGFTRGSQTRRFSKEFFQTFENFFFHSTQREAAKQYPKACQSTHRYQTQSAPLITRKPRR